MFQLESAGMRSFMRDLKPSSFEDIIAGIALFRPGPMDQIPNFVKCKRDHNAVRYEHPLLVPILSNTYGCMVYQEQVMQIVRDLAGYTLAESDKVRRAMSKKKADVMAKEREHFIRGCGERGIDGPTANRIFDSMTDFAQYAFNKSHAAAYAVLCYRTGYLKLHHQAQFMAALVNSVMGVSDKVAEYIGVCRQKGIPILPPDVNKSAAKFSVEGEKPVGADCVRPQDETNAVVIHGRTQFAPTESASNKGPSSVRFGLAGIRNVGFGAAEALVLEREANGYRVYTRRHLFQMRLLRAAFRAEIVSANLRKEALDIVKTSADGNIGAAAQKTLAYRAHIESEISQAKNALILAERMIGGGLRLSGMEAAESGLHGRPKAAPTVYRQPIPLPRRAAAAIIGVSADVLRDWERNGLIDIPREGNWRQYGPNEINLLKIIALLRSANYSQSAIRRMLQKLDHGEKDLLFAIDTPEPDDDIISAADRYITSLTGALADTDEMLAALTDMADQE